MLSQALNHLKSLEPGLKRLILLKVIAEIKAAMTNKKKVVTGKVQNLVCKQSTKSI